MIFYAPIASRHKSSTTIPEIIVGVAIAVALIALAAVTGIGIGLGSFGIAFSAS